MDVLFPIVTTKCSEFSPLKFASVTSVLSLAEVYEIVFQAICQAKLMVWKKRKVIGFIIYSRWCVSILFLLYSKGLMLFLEGPILFLWPHKFMDYLWNRQRMFISFKWPVCLSSQSSTCGHWMMCLRNTIKRWPKDSRLLWLFYFTSYDKVCLSPIL